MSLLKELYQLVIEQECEKCDCEIVWIDEDGNEVEGPTLSEAAGGTATMAFRRKGQEIKRQFRCVSGEKKGRLVADPKTCVKRKNPKRMLVGQRTARSKKGLRLRKSAITRNTSAHKMVRKTNKRLKRGSGTRRPGAK